VVADGLDEFEMFAPATNDWLEQIGNLQLPNLRLLVTSRPLGFDHRRFPRARRLALDGFGSREMQDHLQAIGIPPGFADQVAGLSEGSPLFAGELAEVFRTSPKRFEEYLRLMSTGDARANVRYLISTRLEAAGPEQGSA